ncbi:unnamed protein product [Acanthoscelides obtectus]|uniref:Uncharacterized protein n=1 Tax=Acanthoscelides obtectus TaxID=200917 RepID=A0A9P0KXP7_ACAOB|nr:unnamed protein product [Acanthoscelides obtectus]CAK1649485.1 hypothetical protein AOBTE_LOCUS16271 [Acanthoscelides obtectus]
MGNQSSSIRSFSTAGGESEAVMQGSKVWLFLHRTWTVMTAERWTRTRYAPSTVHSDYDSQYSRYSVCSCSQCRRDGSSLSSFRLV